MTPEQNFGQLLGLGEQWVVTQTRYEDSNHTFYIWVRETARLWEKERCPADGQQPVSCYDHADERRWRHLNVFSHECVILCALPRGRCAGCKHIYRVKPPWEGWSKHFTKEFEAFALMLMKEMPVKRAGEIMGETDTRFWRMLQAHVDEGRGKLQMEGVRQVGVDEMNCRKGHHYVSVFSDLRAKRVLYATEGKDATVWERFAQELMGHNGHPHALLKVTMDMSVAYQKGVRENCRNAAVVFDKFHVIAQVSRAVDEVRQIESRRAEARAQLKGTRWLWRKNPENLTEPEQKRFARIDRQMLWTGKAYQMRLALQQIYQLPYRSQARRKLQSWCNWARRQARKAQWVVFQPMVKAAQMIETHIEGILAYWPERLTNTFMEGLNSVFSAVKRRARGYRSVDYLITMLYFVAGKLDIPFLQFH